MTEVEVHMATYSLFATDHRHKLLTGSTNSIKTVVEVASGKSHLMNVRTSARDFSVELSSCIYSHTNSSCPGCWLM